MSRRSSTHAALLPLLVALTAMMGAKAAAGNVVLIGLSNRQCNAQRALNLDGTVLLAGDKNLVDGPGACCAACKLRSDCNVWTYCATTEGCDSGGRHRECTLKQDWNVAKYQRVVSRGFNWVSGYIGSRCPGTDPTKLLALQRVNFPSFASQCQPGSSCTSCLCQLSKAMSVAQSDPHDVALCMKNFRTVLMFPTELGGGSLSLIAYQRLQQCPVADPPCADQQSSTVFGTLGPAVVPATMGQDIKCLSGNYEKDCATACASISDCSGFLFNAQGSSSGSCCLKLGSGLSWDTFQLSDTTGTQFYWRMPAGTTAEAPFFTQPTPWTGNTTTSDMSSNSITSVATSAASTPSAPSISASDAGSSCTQTACGDVQPLGGYSCAQQAAWGKCGEVWMASFCQQTCKRCPCAGSTVSTGSDNLSSTTAAPSSPAAATPASTSSNGSPSCTCSDVPPGRYSCKDEAAWGKCSMAYMQATSKVPEGYCQISCRRCNCPKVSRCFCTDLQPPTGKTCQQYKEWGACSQEWMWQYYSNRPNGYCQTTCGRCSC